MGLTLTPRIDIFGNQHNHADEVLHDDGSCDGCRAYLVDASHAGKSVSEIDAEQRKTMCLEADNLIACAERLRGSFGKRLPHPAAVSTIDAINAIAWGIKAASEKRG